MASNILTNSFRIGQFNGGNSITNMPLNLASDPFNAILETSVGDAVTDANKRAVNYENDANGPTGSGNEASGTGYTTRGVALGSVTCTQATPVVTFTSANPSWSTATITAYGVWLVKHEAAAGSTPAFAYFTFGGAVTSTAGTFTITVNASGWISFSGG